jgi:hexosaminidase
MIRPILLMALASLASAAPPALMPMPVRLQSSPGHLSMDGSFTAQATAVTDPRLDAAIRRFTVQLSRQTGLLFTSSSPPTGSAAPTLKVECAARGPENPTLGEDESYTLDVAPEGALVKAPAIAGALHGLETFLQLVVPGAGGFEAPAVHIEDRPRFPWRGLMIDSSRHWMPLEVIERNLDAMAAVKLNVFHWHLSDDQGFRVESKRFPKLQELGSDGHYYTQDELRHIVAYARDRGIRVVAEFDIPGHTLSWLAAYPELASEAGSFTIGRTWGIFDPVMDPTRDETYQFLDSFIGEMTAIFPDPYFHIGGDEVNGKSWDSNPRILAFTRQHNLDGPKGLQAYFNQRVSKILEKYHKTVIGWDEVLHPDLPTATVIQSWRGNAALAEAAAKGHRGILSWGYYLDHLRPAAYHYSIDPLGGPAAQLPPDKAANILGGEACMWSEYVSSETIDSRIWPRLAAIAERFWSTRDVTDVDSMYMRLAVVSRWLEWTGVRHRANYGPMLDRLTCGWPAQPVRVLADACEALGLGQGRGRGVKYTSLMPLNRMVDAARPESESVRALELAARNMSPSDITLLKETFTRWAANDALFQPLAAGNALLAELLPLSKDLSYLGSAGLALLSHQPPPSDLDAQLTRIARPQAELRLAAVRPVKILLDARGKAK